MTATAPLLRTATEPARRSNGHLYHSRHHPDRAIDYVHSTTGIRSGSMPHHQHNYDSPPTLPAVPKGINQTEPAGLVGSITAGVTAVIALLVAYGFDISTEQQVAILGVVAVAAPIVAGIVTRGKVYSPASAQRAANESAVTGNATIAPPPAKTGGM